MQPKLLAIVLATLATIALASAQTSTSRLTYATAWNKATPNSAFANFDSWASKFVASSNGTASTVIFSDGLALAKARRTAFLQLIKTNPAQALASTVPASVREHMPSDVLAELETRVSGIGDYVVMGALPAKGGPSVEPIQKFVRLNGQTYRAYIYGRRLGETTKKGIPLNGVVLDGAIALGENPIRQLEANETARSAINFPSASASSTTLAEMGGKVYRFASTEQLQQTEARLEAAEAGIGPTPLESPTTIINQAGQSGAGARPNNSPTPWTTGPKQILVIRVDFSDLPGTPTNNAGSPYTASVVKSEADSQIAPYYVRSSYGLTSMTNTVTTSVYRMPQTANYYATSDDNNQLHIDAETAASANYTLSSYDRIIVLFSWLGDIPGSQINYGGLANIGGPDVWCNGEFDFRVIAHEVGHTYGLYHGNLWQVGDGNPISPSGVDTEYGDIFDTMGANGPNNLETDFNPWFKNILGWVADGQVQTVTANGTYRIYAFDTDNYLAAPGETLALKIVKDGTYNYWIACKRNFIENPSMSNGAYVFWGYNYTRQSDLLDMVTPGISPSDAALPLGGIFTDPAAVVTIRPVADGGIAPNLYLDVLVNFSTNPPLAPMISMEASNESVSLGNDAVFTVSASGIPAPAYQWQVEVPGSTSWVNLSDNASFSGSLTASLTVLDPGSADTGFQFRCIVSNPSGSVTSAPPAVLTVSSPLVVSTLAGSAGNPGNANGTGTNALFYYPAGTAVDKAGNVYVADFFYGTIRKITPAGVVTTFANFFHGPSGVALDTAGNVYVADTYHQTIQKITPGGTVSPVAGMTGVIGSANGTNTSARFNYPGALIVDAATNIYVADTGNNLIRKITPSGNQWVVTTIAGITNGGSANGPGTNAQFDSPNGIALDNATNLYIADTSNYRIQKLTPDLTHSNWTSTTVAGQPLAGETDGVGTNAQFYSPWGIAVDSGTHIYVVDNDGQRIRKIATDKTGTNWVVSTLAGVSYQIGSTDGVGTNALFYYPQGISVDSSTNLYIADTVNYTIRVGRFASVVIPSLGIAYTNNQVVLSWPIPTTTFSLQVKTNLSGAPWAPGPAPALVNGKYVVTNTTPGKTLFFRLQN